MGYYMNQRDAYFVIKKENFDKALAAVKALGTKAKLDSGGGCWRGGDKVESSYSWVTTQGFMEAKTLKQAIEAWRWNPEIDDNGDICHIYFSGEKLGDDAVLFEALAPYVETDSYIEMAGEESAIWRWCFDDGDFEEKFATISWDN